MNSQILCAECGQLTSTYDAVRYGSADQAYRDLCSQCFNTMAAGLDGLKNFHSFKLEPVEITDIGGEVHQFHFRARLLGIPGVALDAFELRDGEPAGYQFQILGESDADILVLLGRLIERIRRALSIEHLVPGSLGPQIANQGTVRGRVGWDPKSEGLPLLVIDGREFTFEQFGRMLMTYEGWNFKLSIYDKSEEL